MRRLVVSSPHVLGRSFDILLHTAMVLRGEPALCHFDVGIALKTWHFVDDDGFYKRYFVAMGTKIGRAGFVVVGRKPKEMIPGSIIIAR